MKKSVFKTAIFLLFSILIVFILPFGCKKMDNPIKFQFGTFPDSIKNMSNINSAYDDYNIGLYELGGKAYIVFSSNRKSSGDQFDLEQAEISFTFNQTNGEFIFSTSMINDSYLTKLITQAETEGNDFGPYRFFSKIDGYDYLVLASQTQAGDLDLYYLKNQPIYDSGVPNIDGPYTVNLLNSLSDDAYFALNFELDTAYYVSDKAGDFNIYLAPRPEAMSFSDWFDSGYTESFIVDSINSTSNDKCPILFKDVMIFASDRPGGLGGFDLYYSVFRNGKWNSPVNLGPRVNSASDEYRPVIGIHPEFNNLFMMFSSNRPGGAGGFDLYFTGVSYPLE